MSVNRYDIRMDGDVMPNSYTYEELLLNDILEFDDIEIKQVSKSNWTNIKSYYFPEEHEEGNFESKNFYVDENGQVHFNENQIKKNRQESEYIINECGEVVIRTDSASKTKSTSAPSRITQIRPSSSISSPSDGDGWKIFKVIITILIIGAVIAVIANDGWGAVSIPPVIWILNKMWNNN